MEVVQARMADIQAQIAAGDYQLHDVFNGDESGMIFGAQPKRQYVPIDADRAVTPEGDDKSRFTAFLYGDATGKMLPTFVVIKGSAKCTVDLSSTRVVANLMNDSYFAAYEGWQLKLWQQELSLQGKQNPTERKMYKRPYLINTRTGDVITTQSNLGWTALASLCSSNWLLVRTCHETRELWCGTTARCTKCRMSAMLATRLALRWQSFRPR